MSKLKKFLIITGAVIVVIAAAFVIMIISLDKQLSAYESINVSDLDLSTVEDGTYTGSEDAGVIKATVEVTVKDHAITQIKILEHDNGQGKPAETIVNDIVEKNSLEVDTVSGATHSSNVIRMAVYNALTK
jgi:uncharacterized protein with FMN-binding domain